MSRIALESDVTLSSVHYMTTASDVRCQWYVSYLVLCSLLLVRRVCQMYLALIHFAPVEWSAGKIVSKVTYNMSTGMLNPAVAIHICCSSETVWYWLWSALFLTLLARLIVVMKLQLDCPGAWILSHLTLWWLHSNHRATDHYRAVRWLVHWPLMGGLFHPVSSLYQM